MSKFIEFTELFCQVKISIDVSSIISVMKPANSGTIISTEFHKYEVSEGYQEVLDMINSFHKPVKLPVGNPYSL